MGKGESPGLSRLMKGSLQSPHQLGSSCGSELALSAQPLFNSIFLVQWSLVRREPWLHPKCLWEVHSAHHLVSNKLLWEAGSEERGKQKGQETFPDLGIQMHISAQASAVLRLQPHQVTSVTLEMITQVLL